MTGIGATDAPPPFASLLLLVVVRFGAGEMAGESTPLRSDGEGELVYLEEAAEERVEVE